MMAGRVVPALARQAAKRAGYRADKALEAYRRLHEVIMGERCEATAGEVLRAAGVLPEGRARYDGGLD